MSGPKRYDWVVMPQYDKTIEGEGKGEGESEGTGKSGTGTSKGDRDRGEWVYLRDGSTLKGLLEEEVGVLGGGGVEG